MMMTKNIKAAVTAVAIAVGTIGLPAGHALAADPVYTSIFSNVAVGGYDAVAYFEDNKPVKGSKKFQTAWNGATWRFSSQDNLDQFVANPQAFAPQYGGYCAWAVSQGYTASGDPKYWAIVDDKLYLNYNEEVQRDWDVDRPGFIAKADGNWPSVLDQ